ncbi:hypothetical protein Xets_04123 [Xenorhabdus sp. TS4]|nr:hypothetical protein [Xenorhabdus sp. TS4]
MQLCISRIPTRHGRLINTLRKYHIPAPPTERKDLSVSCPHVSRVRAKALPDE